MATKHPESHSCLNCIVSCAFIVYIRKSIDNESIGLLSQQIPIRQVDKNIIKLWKTKSQRQNVIRCLDPVLRSLLLNGRCIVQQFQPRLNLRKILRYLCTVFALRTTTSYSINMHLLVWAVIFSISNENTISYINF